MTEQPKQAAQAGEVDERVAFPDECVASGQSCQYGPYGQRGEKQCRYCGSPPSLPTQPAAQATQQAAGEPVGEPFKVEQCMQVASDEFDAFLIGGCKGEPPRMSMAFASTLFKTIIRERGMFFTATHPAPGVPEGAREALERIASWNEHPAMLGVDYGSNGVRDYYRKIASDALAAAQAKGG